jgi:hypothetical protein
MLLHARNWAAGFQRGERLYRSTVRERKWSRSLNSFFRGPGLFARRGRTSNLADCRRKKAAHERSVEFVVVVDSEMPHQFPSSFQRPFRIGEQSSAIETKIHAMLIRHDVAKAILERLAGKRKSNGNRIAVDQRFHRFGRLLKHDFAQSQSEVSDLGTVPGQRVEQPAIGRACHVRQTSTDLVQAVQRTDVSGGASGFLREHGFVRDEWPKKRKEPDCSSSSCSHWTRVYSSSSSTGRLALARILSATSCGTTS